MFKDNLKVIVDDDQITEEVIEPLEGGAEEKEFNTNTYQDEFDEINYASTLQTEGQDKFMTNITNADNDDLDKEMLKLETLEKNLEEGNFLILNIELEQLKIQEELLQEEKERERLEVISFVKLVSRKIRKSRYS